MNRGVEDFGKLIGIGGRACAADCQLFLRDILKLCDTTRVPCDTDAHFVVHAANPIELGRIELCLRRAQQRIESSTSSDHAERAAVLGRDIVEPVGEHETPGARHVLRHDRRIAGDEAPDVPRQRPSIDVIPTASAVADVKINRLALVETQWILRVRVQGGAERQKCGGADCGQNAHLILLWRFYFRPCRRDVASSGPIWARPERPSVARHLI